MHTRPATGKTYASRPLLANFAAFGSTAATGLVLNFVIARVYGPDALGVFNQAYGIYILASQLAVLGLHYSTLKFVAEDPDDAARVTRIAGSATLLSISTATLVVVVGWLGADTLARWFDSAPLATAWLAILPGLWAFSINKVMLAVLNGVQAMTEFALWQILRAIVMLVAVFAISRNPDFAAARLTLIISIAELSVFAGLFLRLVWLRHLAIQRPGPWLRRHLAFGLRGAPSGALAELNTRVDIVMLGLFSSDRNVGLYTLPALLVEGLGQVGVVLRNFVNPGLSYHAARTDHDRLQARIRRGKRRVYLLYLFLVSIAAALWRPIVDLLAGSAYTASTPVFLILLLGLLLRSGYIPFNMVLLQMGFPGAHTLFVLAVVVVNALLNALLIPVWSLNGAAIATSTAMVLSVLFLRLQVRRRSGLRI